MNIFTPLESESESGSESTSTSNCIFNTVGIFKVPEMAVNKDVLWMYISRYIDNIFSLKKKFN